MHHSKGRFRTADAEQIRAAVLADIGISQVPGYLFTREIADGSVRVILRDYQLGAFPISAVHPAGRRLPAKVRVFIEFLEEILR